MTVVAALTLVGCGDDGADDASSDSVAATTATSADTAADVTPPADTTGMSESTGGTEDDGPAGDTTVAIIDTEFGAVLGDGTGKTLYVFIPDGQGPSTCVDGCLANWPALIGPADAGDGVDEALLGTATRPDEGGEQVTYNGWPLYYFAGDLGPGDVSGQGVGDVWFVIDAAGEAIPSG